MVARVVSHALDAAGERERRANSLLRLAADLYWEQDSEFRLTFMSSHMGERTGLAAADYLGRRRWDLPAPNLTEADWARRIMHVAVSQRSH